ncbi:hypothetical protein, partial [Enterococcus faecium]|uniref:hypothetical protein n=1 Tax=Enterococcus faecium TaxID=1352 RepID=UPI001C4F069F
LVFYFFVYHQAVLSFFIFASCFFHINRSRFSFLMKKIIIPMTERIGKLGTKKRQTDNNDAGTIIR